VRALSPVNVNADGESLPVKIRIYALRDDARFRAAPFTDLWTKDREVLGDDRLQDPKVVIVPPASLRAAPQQIELSELPKEARFLGIVALIQHADQPDRRRAVIARIDIGSQIIDLVDSSIVMHAQGDPVPGRSAPRQEVQSSSPGAQPTAVAANNANNASTATSAPAAQGTGAGGTASGSAHAPAAPASAAAGPAASPAAPGTASPVANSSAPSNFGPGGSTGNSGQPPAARGRGTAGQGQ
jgi:type VI secretion system VasD/TssJ family lipoprotein